jgi:geranylgeranyl diphosphate synthase type I
VRPSGAIGALDDDRTDGLAGVDDSLPAAVEAAVEDYLAGRLRDAAAIDPAVGEAAQVLAGFLRGGKRVRPRFAWWGWRGAGGDPGDPDAPAVLRAISALELVQAGALVHDDLIDDSATRRGNPTVHVRFADRHAAQGRRGRPDRFGAAAAILLGDLALAWADDMLRAAELPPAAAARAAEPWAAMRTEVLAGQYLDVLHQATGEDSVAGALRVPRFKTAAYTVERPLHLGAALAGADEALVAGYRRYGADIGVAFQLRDDLLGVFGDPSVTGKPAGDDLREGKRTLLLALGMRSADDRGEQAARAVLDAAVGDPDLTDAGLDRVRALLVDLGAVAAVEQRIAELTGSALRALAAADVAEPAATRLAELAVATTNRHR